MSTLTQHLLSLNPSAFTSATRSTFLSAAGQGTLPKFTLQQWLSQDRLYAQAYVRFASKAISKLSLPAVVDPGCIQERLLDLLLEALNNVRRELKFFEEVAEKEGLQIDAKEEGDGVKGYRMLFEDTAEKGLLQILVLLWGTEKCYLEAWRYAASLLPAEAGGEQDGGALRREFIPNWTSIEFVEFVERIEELLEEVWLREDRGKEGAMAGLEKLWERVLKVEEAFWPVVE